MRASNLGQGTISAIVKEAPRTPSGLYLLLSQTAGWFSARQNLMEIDPEHINIIEPGEIANTSRRGRF